MQSLASSSLLFLFLPFSLLLQCSASVFFRKDSLKSRNSKAEIYRVNGKEDYLDNIYKLVVSDMAIYLINIDEWSKTYLGIQLAVDELSRKLSLERG